MAKTPKNQRKIGKGSPPAEHSWKPGQSGNPNGRPKGTPNGATVIRKWLEVMTKSQNPFTKVEEEMSVEDALVLRQIIKAKNGDTKAFDTLMDRLHGKAVQAIDHTSGGEKIEQKEVIFRDYTKDKND